MKITHLKLFLTLAIFVGIANVDANAASNIAAASIPPIAADLRIIESCVGVTDIDIQASFPIIII